MATRVDRCVARSIFDVWLRIFCGDTPEYLIVGDRLYLRSIASGICLLNSHRQLKTEW
ncbi:hypothetical protein [Microcoleus sp. PH2017_30_WIL_O_A]|uniref:hypothetical protein n=1 Tax=Microcoleus sp. PH2017_30_WIL_O_A TaxID=2798840 RepID=UPI001D6EE68F|nr:hypothetical protein [Microcoleus sp. PH2017_30_WIL_O_A]MCC3584779.1 hypothetical protein [Microcoleus sp. PH2017_30_WIL_O_A]